MTKKMVKVGCISAVDVARCADVAAMARILDTRDKKLLKLR